jgi:hypothetical protein
LPKERSVHGEVYILGIRQVSQKANANEIGCERVRVILSKVDPRLPDKFCAIRPVLQKIKALEIQVRQIVDLSGHFAVRVE